MEHIGWIIYIIGAVVGLCIGIYEYWIHRDEDNEELGILSLYGLLSWAVVLLSFFGWLNKKYLSDKETTKK